MPLEERLSVDPKPAAMHCLRGTSSHHVKYISEALLCLESHPLGDASDYCQWRCQDPKTHQCSERCPLLWTDAETESGESAPADICIAGFPCAPFSVQRTGRRSGGCFLRGQKKKTSAIPVAHIFTLFSWMNQISSLPRSWCFSATIRSDPKPRPQAFKAVFAG